MHHEAHASDNKSSLPGLVHVQLSADRNVIGASSVRMELESIGSVRGNELYDNTSGIRALDI